MSSSKDYLFEIVTNSSQNSVSFTVRNKPSVFLRYFRMPLACLLVAGLFPHAQRFWDEIYGIITMEGEFSSHSFNSFEKNAHFFSVLLALAGLVLLVSIQQTADTFMVMEDLGVQIGSRPRFRFMNQKRGKFIPISEIIDIVIHEGFQGFEVIYYMCVLMREKDNSGGEGNGVKVIFPNYLPRKDILLQTWKASRQMLYGTTRRHYRHVPGQGLREVNHLH